MTKKKYVIFHDQIDAVMQALGKVEANISFQPLVLLNSIIMYQKVDPDTDKTDE
jgi:hypothetical protein